MADKSLVQLRAEAATYKNNKRTTMNSRRRIADAGGVLAAAQTAASTLGKGVMGTMKLMDKPRNTIMAATTQLGANLNKNPNDNGSVAQAAWNGFTQKKVIYGSDVMKNLGVKSKTGQLVGGLALDMASDPLSYMTLGVGSFAKGVATGAGSTLGRDAIQAAARKAAYEASSAGKQRVFKAAGVNKIDELAGKLGGNKDAAYNLINKVSYGSYFDQAKQALPNAKSYEIYQAAAKAYGQKQAGKFAAQQTANAGRGFSVGGKTIFSGAKMQDAGARVAQKLGGTSVGGHVGDVVEDVVRPMFSTKSVAGLDRHSENILKNIELEARGAKASADLITEQAGKNLAVLSRGLTWKGETLDRAIDKIIAKNGDGITRADLNTVITTTPAKKFAAKQLAAGQSHGKVASFIKDPENMTLGELINVYARQYKKMAISEVREGVLNGSNINMWRSTDLADDLANGRNTADQYLPRVQAAAKGAFNIRGGKTKQLQISNVYARKRDPKYVGQSVEEINEDIANSSRMQGLGNDKDFLERSQVKAFVTRALTSNKMLADKDMVEKVINTFGEAIPAGTDRATLDALLRDGYAIISPKHSYNLLMITDNISAKLGQVMPKATAGQVQAIKSGDQILKDLGSDEALNLLIQSKGQAKIYAVKRGVVDHVNLSAAQQIDAGVQQTQNLIQAFYKVWKPAVTGMRFAYHARNLGSSQFNNFLNLGMEMFKPSVQKNAALVALFGRGSNHVVDPMMQKVAAQTITINGRKWTIPELHKAMVENSAMNTFMLTDAATLSDSILKDVDAAISGGLFKRAVSLAAPQHMAANFLKMWAGAGKIAGNTIEEYVRATNFIANLSRGLSPADAAQMVNKYHFDYQDLTKTEQALKQNFIPFYTWMRKNMPMQFESFLNDPRPYETLYRGTQEGSNVYDMDYSQVPQYVQENMGIPIGTNEQGRIRILDAGLPVSDLSTGWKDIVTGLGPIVKAAIELTTNQNLLTGAPIDRTGYDYAVKMLDALGGKDKAPQIIEDFLMTPQGAAFAKGLYYARQNAGVFRDVGSSGKVTAEAPASQVIQQGKNYSTNKSAIARSFLSQLDPNFTKYYSPDAAATSAGYDEQRRLDNTIQRMKKMGYNVRTMNEVKP